MLANQCYNGGKTCACSRHHINTIVVKKTKVSYWIKLMWAMEAYPFDITRSGNLGNLLWIDSYRSFHCACNSSGRKTKLTSNVAYRWFCFAGHRGQAVDFQIRTTTFSTLDLSSRLTHPHQRIAKGRRNFPTFITQYDAVVAVRTEKKSGSVSLYIFTRLFVSARPRG